MDCADGAGLLDHLADSRIGRLAQIFNEHQPAGLTVLFEEVVGEIDRIVRDTADFIGWQDKPQSVKEVRKQLRAVFSRFKLPLTSEPWDFARAYVLQSY